MRKVIWIAAIALLEGEQDTAPGRLTIASTE